MIITIKGYEKDCKGNKRNFLHIIFNVDKKNATNVAWKELIKWQELGIFDLRATVV